MSVGMSVGEAVYLLRQCVRHESLSEQTSVLKRIWSRDDLLVAEGTTDSGGVRWYVRIASTGDAFYDKEAQILHDFFKQAI